MANTLADDIRIKELFKEALSEVLDQRREWLATLMVEALEDMALVQAIKEGAASEVVSREEIFALLETKR
jgi:hypothetical protein